MYERYFNIHTKLITEAGLEQRWIDTLARHKESVFESLNKDIFQSEDFMFKVMDSLGVPFPAEKMRSRFNELYHLEDAKNVFSNTASEGKYTHVINMPWQIVRTNADSISGNRLQWNPSSMKFILNDYTMYAESRKANYWAFIVSTVVVVFTLYLFITKKK
jgi:hypothetical protein